jgi:hypothetical protein
MNSVDISRDDILSALKGIEGNDNFPFCRRKDLGYNLIVHWLSIPFPENTLNCDREEAFRRVSRNRKWLDDLIVSKIDPLINSLIEDGLIEKYGLYDSPNEDDRCLRISNKENKN